MDKIKDQLAVAMKYGFWIGSVAVLLGSLGIWYMTTSKLSEENASQTSKIKQAISTVSTVQSEISKHPNEISHAEMKLMIEKRQQQVLESWQTLYDRQRDILTWPEEELTKNFVDEFRDLLPIEVHVDFPTLEEDEKETTLLATYQRYIKKALPGIAEIAKAEWTAEFESATSGMGLEMGGMSGMSGMGGGYGGMMGSGGMMMGRGPIDITGATGGPLVKWSAASQSTLLTDLFPWRGTLPSTLEVYYSQENLWVLKQLLQIIAELNGDVRQPYQAQIHEIVKIGIGSSVKGGSGTISKPGENVVMGGMSGMSGMDMYDLDSGGMGSGGMDSGMDGMSSGMGTVEEPDPADNRYVNEAGEQIDAASLRGALTTDRPDNVALAVAKRVPVMMSLKMNQRAVPELLAICGSVPLMVHVNQVRILPPTASSASSTYGGGEMDMGMSMSSGVDDMMSMGSGMDMGMGMGMSGPSTKGPVAEFPLDMNVEIYGLIYIYNPPDPSKLALDQVNSENVDELIDDAAVPAAGLTAAADDANGELPVPKPDTAEQQPETAEQQPVTAEPSAGQPAEPPAANEAAGTSQPVVTPPAAAQPDPDAPATTSPESPRSATP